MGWIADFFDISIDRANQFYAWGWRASVAGAVITMCGVGLLWLGTRVRDHDFEESIADLHQRAAISEADTLEANKKLEIERGARLALLKETEPRDINAEQIEKFVAKIKGMVTELNVYSIPDREAQRFGVVLTIALHKAGVKSEWKPLYTFIPGAFFGVLVYEPKEELASKMMTALAESTGLSIGRYLPMEPSPDIPSPAVIVGWQEQPLVRKPFPGWPTERQVPWDPK
jgi:hypothetical protein